MNLNHRDSPAYGLGIHSSTLNHRFLPRGNFTNTLPGFHKGEGITKPLRPLGSLTTVPGTIVIGVSKKLEILKQIKKVFF